MKLQHKIQYWFQTYIPHSPNRTVLRHKSTDNIDHGKIQETHCERAFVNRSDNVVSTREKLEYSTVLEIVIRVITILSEGETWLTRARSMGGLSGSEIVLSGTV